MGLTGDDTLDYLAETICQQVLTNGMSETERARALYTWCGKNLTYRSGSAQAYRQRQELYGQFPAVRPRRPLPPTESRPTA